MQHEDIEYRELNTNDSKELQNLHEDWFPIRYSQSFYDNAVKGFLFETGQRLFTQVAVLKTNDIPHLQASNPEETELLVGAITAQMVPTTQVGHGQVIENPMHYSQMMYLLTIGARKSCRRQGVATKLLEVCIEEARRYSNCGAIYLHVKTDNHSGIRFYEKNGFQRAQFLRDYYVINGDLHDAYLYVKYINGAIPARGWVDYIAHPLLEMWSFATTAIRRKWAQYFRTPPEERAICYQV